MTTLLGTTADGRTLTYDASLYEFFLDGEQASFADAQMLDARGFLRWRADVLRDWFVHIDSTALASCNARARALAAARGADRALGAGRTRAALPARQDEGRADSGYAEPASAEALASEPVRAEVASSEPTAEERRENEPVVAASETREPVVIRLKSAFSQSFKSKGGKLAKDKSFELSSCIDAPVFFSKMSGTPYVIVSEEGEVDVFWGLESGLHVIQAQAVPKETYENVSVIETIAIEVRVK